MAAPEMSQDPILRACQPGFVERELRQAAESHNGVTEGRLHDNGAAHLAWCRRVDLP